ncbi:hypothetical protein Tco_0876828 [Tanacetum coccineum]|uniref:Uncharacterized protein n=1 Tax=Tanacetum coccineum TaxID=301880 RepID=A0ABQ5BWB5_9ASTR
MMSPLAPQTLAVEHHQLSPRNLRSLVTGIIKITVIVICRDEVARRGDEIYGLDKQGVVKYWYGDRQDNGLIWDTRFSQKETKFEVHSLETLTRLHSSTWATKWFKRLVAYAKCNRDSYESEGYEVTQVTLGKSSSLAIIVQSIEQRKQAFEQEMQDLDVEIKKMKVFKASYDVTTEKELHFRYSDTTHLSRSVEVLKLKNFKKDATIKLFKNGMSMSVQKSQVHKVAKFQDGKEIVLG